MEAKQALLIACHDDICKEETIEEQHWTEHHRTRFIQTSPTIILTLLISLACNVLLCTVLLIPGSKFSQSDSSISQYGTINITFVHAA